MSTFVSKETAAFNNQLDRFSSRKVYKIVKASNSSLIHYHDHAQPYLTIQDMISWVLLASAKI